MREKSIIFLISQPRSGSTLLQRLLGAHSNIYTRSEPWIMLHPSYTLKQSGIYAEYNFRIAREAFEEFLSGLPNGKQKYLELLRNMYLELYADYLEDTSYIYFLDKTPRYHLVVNELVQIFPEAKYILLIRNPLAVLGSIINSWVGDSWFLLAEYKQDLLSATRTYIQILDDEKSPFMITRYEEIVEEPEQALKKLFNYLSIEFENCSEKYFLNDEKWTLGDQANVYEKKSIDSSIIDKWQEQLINPQYWRVMYDYLLYIGKDNYEKLGYCFEECQQILEQKMPAASLEAILSRTFSLSSLLEDTRECLIENQRSKNEVARLRRLVEAKDKQLETMNLELKERNSELNRLYNSRSYKLATLIRSPYAKIRKRIK